MIACNLGWVDVNKIHEFYQKTTPNKKPGCFHIRVTHAHLIRTMSR